MESDSDGDGELEATFTSMRQPPLIKQLRGILSEYPDGGQIIKELLQNAEDAGASEVKLLYDSRSINQLPDSEKKYTKFFQAPALCVYNDAVFTEQDWEGIEMIYNSVKEEDKMKVGRFGLGFKSVFHITDYPCVISGDYLLMINPQEDISKVNAKMNLKKLNRYKGMNVSALQEALCGTFEIDENKLKNGGYQGTIFWFPLRQNPSKVSETVYSEEKVYTLFEAFKAESSSILIFLKNLTRISLYHREAKDIALIQRTELVQNEEKGLQEREKFKQRLIATQNASPATAISSNAVLTVEVSDGDHTAVSRWLVVNYLMGNNASDQFTKLINNGQLGLTPYVGIAAPLDELNGFVGHIFCFLPLPREGSQLTGLPFHVNGFFSLSQSRHHLKWATDEQSLKQVSDSAIQWNERLISECLPKAYTILLQSLIHHSDSNRNPHGLIQSVYNAIPDPRVVFDSKWKFFLKQLIVQNMPLLLRQESLKSRRFEWIPVNRARFATLSDLPKEMLQVKPAIVKALFLLGEEYVDVTQKTFEKLAQTFTITDLTPEILGNLLKHNHVYKSMKREEKLNLLIYLLSGKTYRNVEGLELLPLASGGWVKFSQYTEIVYASTDEEMELLPGLENRLLLARSKIPPTVTSSLDHLIHENCFQLRTMGVSDMLNLIRSVLTSHLGSGYPLHISSTSGLSISWVQKVWKYIKSKADFSNVETIPLLPVPANTKGKVSEGTWKLVKLSDCLISKQLAENCLSEHVCAALEDLGIHVVSSVPEWIPKLVISRYICKPTPESAISLISRIATLSNVANITTSFNEKTDKEHRRALLQFIGHCVLTDANAQKFLRGMKMFEEVKSTMTSRGFISLSENRCFASDKYKFIRYPGRYIDTTYCTKTFLKSLGASEEDEHKLVLGILQAIINCQYTEAEKTMFMKHFVERFSRFENHHDIVDRAKKVPFIKTSTGDRMLSGLFNPHSTFLQKLFLEEDLFPSLEQISQKHLNTFKALGLKDIRDVTADALLQTASILDTWAKSGKKDEQIKTKSTAFLKFLKESPGILVKLCQGNRNLKTELLNLNCIKYEKAASNSFPLPWNKQPFFLCTPAEAKDAKMFQIVGCTMPLVKSNDALNKAFAWSSLPPLDKVLDQLALMRNSYDVKNKPEILPLIKCVYGHLNTRRREDLSGFVSQELIWVGNGFTNPKHSVINHSGINLQPYMYNIPQEFSTFETLFKVLGCHLNQTVDVLLGTLEEIRIFHSTPRAEAEIKRDTLLVLEILENISSRSEDIGESEKQMYIPIHCENKQLVLKPLSVCAYDSQRRYYLLEDIEVEMYFIHEGLPLEIAEKLGIKSVSTVALSETEELEFEEWGQDEPLTTRIKTLLNEGYKDGLSVPKELIQNADDAKVSELKFLYDERENDDMKGKIFSTEMKECQGAALWVFNNARFSSADLENIIKLNGATKENDSQTIGKFGLGFCSVYNLTDVPSFISGNNIVMFDPHKVYLPQKCSGMKIDLTKKQNRYLLRQHADQFKHFENVFGCRQPGPDFQEFDGTLFRFPLRTKHQANWSKIKSKPYTRDKVFRLLDMFMKTAGNMLLFTQNLRTIEIYHLPSNADPSMGCSLLFKMTREDVSQRKSMVGTGSVNLLCEAEQKFKRGIQFREVQHIKITLEVSELAEALLQENNIQALTVTSSWLVSWAFGTKQAWQKARETKRKGALPLASVGLPVHNFKTLMPLAFTETVFGFYTSGHVYCFLPLPLTIPLQVHINGCFDVTSDRRQLPTIAEDDMSYKAASWNEGLMTDSVVNAFVQLLTVLAQKHISSSYVYYALWPLERNSLLQSFQDSFYEYIAGAGEKVFKSQNRWISYHDAVFLDPKLQQNTSIGNTAFEMLLHFQPRKGKVVVEMPEKLLNSIAESIGSVQTKKHMISEEELFDVFFDNVLHSYWQSKPDERNNMVLFAVTNSSDVIKGRLRTAPCIPCEPNGTLHKLEDLVDPSSPIADMYTNSDGVFPKEQSCFRSPEILSCLRKLGMLHDSMPAIHLLNRCESVEKIGRSCCDCAYDRCKSILRYLSSSSTQTKILHDEPTLTSVRKSLLLPVLPRPSTWVFPWKGDTDKSLKEFASSDSCASHVKNCNHTIKFGLANQLFRNRARDCVGLVMSILDDDVCPMSALSYFRPVHVFKLLKIGGYCEDVVPTSMLIKQIELLSATYLRERKHEKELKRLLDASFDILNHRLVSDPHSEELNIEDLNDKKVVLFGTDLIAPNVVAFKLEGDCSPDLFQLPDTEAVIRKEVYSAMGVVDHFSAVCIVNVLRQKKNRWLNEPCQEMLCIQYLLNNLAASMERDGVCLDELDSDSIVAPDINCILRPTYELVVDDEDFQTSVQMKTVHGSISSMIAKAVGVKLKEKQCLDHISAGVAFGQKEKLVNRLNNLLHAYPCRESILKELVQNADDAKASEIHFIKDYRTNSSQGRTFRGRYSELQGPALCVYNDSYFTADDLEGIQNLGEGSKVKDPTQTGQYGVGFNVVYHLTDAPSFMTKGPFLEHGGTLCILDPLCNYVPNVTIEAPGRRFQIDGLKESFPGVLPGYLERHGFFKAECGTMFRFPLRRSESAISEKFLSTEALDELLSSLHSDMFETLLFLKHLKRIKISNVTTGELVEEYSIQINLSEDDELKRKMFFHDVNAIAKRNIENKVANLFEKQMKIDYKMRVEDSKGSSKTWYVHQRFGCDEDLSCYDTVIESFKKGHLGLLPLGGVAVPIVDCMEKPFEKLSLSTVPCKAFCFLPLPIQTGLPVHVNGHFALDHEARRSLWEEGYRKEWNEVVVKTIIIPSWIASLQSMQTEIVYKHLDDVSKWSSMNVLMTMYHGLFPSLDQVVGKIWHMLAKEFYTTIFKQRSEVFPVVQKQHTETNSGPFKILWVALSRPDSPFDGVFRDFQQSHDEANTLKSIGIQLIETPQKIYKCMRSGDDIRSCSPDFVISFLKSFVDCSTRGHFELGEINVPVANTKLQDIGKLLVITHIIMKAEKFWEKAEGLPIIVTSDGKLRQCSSSSKVFLFKYVDLLPMSGHQILHEKLMYMYNFISTDSSRYVTKLAIDDFLRLLPDSFSDDLTGHDSVCWEKERGVPLSEQWIANLFQYLYEEAQEKSTYSSDKYINHEQFKTLLAKLGRWNFLPTIQISEGKSSLFPISHTFRTMVSECVLDPNLEKCLTKIKLPTIDESVFKHCHDKHSVFRAVRKCAASADNPYELLLCLAHYVDVIPSCELNPDEAVTLLQYFGKHLKSLKEKHGSSIIANIRKLPLYLTQQDTLVDLSSFSTALVLPSDLPSQGIEQWGQTTGILILKKREALYGLYRSLGLNDVALETVYAKWILPKFKHLPQEHWLSHIVYIRDNLLQHFQHRCTDTQRQIIETLKGIAFVPVDETMKCVKELHDPEHPVLKIMLSTNCFPPKDFLKLEWRDLLDELGLIKKPNGEMMLSYAHTIEREGAHKIDDMICEKSKIVVSYFLSVEDWSIDTLNKIRTVKFVLPYRISAELRNIFCQHDEGNNLICFQGSTLQENKLLCWSAVSIISQTIKDENMQSKLGISKHLKVTDVVHHCQNVCGALEASSHEHGSFLQKMMEDVYSYFLEHIPLDEEAKGVLKHTPIVFIPDEMLLVNASKVVIELSEKEEIKPYLFRAPRFYGKFFEVFTEFGCENKASWIHYARVLEQMKSELGDTCMFGSELVKVRSAVQNLFCCLEDSNTEHTASLTTQNEVTKLYLPNKSKSLQNTEQMVISDNPDLEARVSNKLGLSYFIGFRPLEIHCASPKKTFKTLPVTLQPRFLSDIVLENVILTDMQVLSSRKARIIEHFIHSDEFIEGVLRLVQHQCGEIHERVHVNPIRSNLQAAKVLNVSGLKTVLYQNGTAIRGTEKTKHCFVKNEACGENTVFKLYFQTGNESNPYQIDSIIDKEGGLSELIDKCSLGLLEKDTYRYLPTILRLIETPHAISGMLFSLGIAEYSLASSGSSGGSIFPKPGTVVEKIFHPFLEQGMSPFKKHEYEFVALELEDAIDDAFDAQAEDNNELPEPVYIYVHILKEIRDHSNGSFVHIKYEIDAGNYNPDSGHSNIYVVSISRLFRFVRKKTETSTILVPYSNESAEEAEPFDATCRRIRETLIDAWNLPEVDRKRVIRRLQLQWHPDKNYGNEEYCTRVFNYIQSIIQRLKNGEAVRVDEDVNDETGRTASNTSRSPFDFNINRRARAYARAFREDFHEYEQSTGTGRFARGAAAEKEVSNVREAKRWMRQAKNDYLAAVSTMPSMSDVQGYNWVCYECHQACEKALKAAWFAKNANNSSVRQSNSLTDIANGLSEELLNQARRIESRIGPHSRMRYPDSVAGTRIPSDQFSREDAEYVLEITKELLDNVEERF